MIKFQELVDYGSESLTLATNTESPWFCEIDAGRVELGLVISCVDMYEATGEDEFKAYPWVTSIEIMALNPSVEPLDNDVKESGIHGLDLIPDMYRYCGGVNIEHDLLSADERGRNFRDNLKARVAKLITHKADFGTLAAQQGRGAELTYPQFKTEGAAREFCIDLITHYADGPMRFIGFTLDRPVNLVGDSGWETIKTQIGKSA